MRLWASDFRGDRDAAAPDPGLAWDWADRNAERTHKLSADPAVSVARS